MSSIIYTSCQPDHIYFVWQLEIQFLNFIDIGIDLSHYHVLVGMRSENISKEFLELQSRYPTVNFHFLKDTRIDRSYIPTLKPHLMSKFYSTFDTSKYSILYIDSDVIFREQLQLEQFCNDEVIYMSDTSSYLNADYINSKGSTLLQEMCDIVGVDIRKILLINKYSGGAQYLLKNLNSTFWDKVERDSLSLYNYMLKSRNRFAEEFCTKTQKTVDDYRPIQSWCAEMWATLWNLVVFNCQLSIHSELDFCFATSPSQDYFKNKILHNAGVTERSKHEMFFKGDFRHGLPLDLNLSYVSNKFTSYYYALYVEKLLELRRKY